MWWGSVLKWLALSPDFWGRKRGWTLSSTTWPMMNQSCLHQSSSEIFEVGEHTKVLGGWCAQRGHGNSVYLLPYIVQCSFILYNKQATVNKVPSWTLWLILTNYQMGGSWELQIYSNLGRNIDISATPFAAGIPTSGNSLVGLSPWTCENSIQQS